MTLWTVTLSPASGLALSGQEKGYQSFLSGLGMSHRASLSMDLSMTPGSEAWRVPDRGLPTLWLKLFLEIFVPQHDVILEIPGSSV